ncbi:Putative transmembrane protein [Minicystis rosea]|nr:Putative transmembrane protein [Minicystis rosea]
MLALAYPEAFARAADAPRPILAVAGLAVGFGARLGNGCTSGHGVCGVSRLSARSIVATCVFMTAGALSVLATRHLLGSAR